MKNSKKQVSTISIILIVQLVVLLVLSLIITGTVSSKTKANSIDHMATITDERAQIIDSYVRDAEKTLTAYSEAAQIYNILKAPTDPEATAAAQSYTERFSTHVDNLEGIYVSEWNTHVLAHTYKTTVGITTRTEQESLNALHDSLLEAGNDVYDTGIIISPASNKQVVSMYKAVYDEKGKPMGLVGLGIYTEGLINTLNSMEIRGFDNSFYSMVNTADGKYIFNNDQKLVGKEVESGEIKSLCKKLRSQKESKVGSFEYKDGGSKYVSTYSYMPDHGWILMLDDTTSEVYSLTKSMMIYLGVFFVALLILVVIFNKITKAQNRVNEKLASTMIKNTKAKESLHTAMFKDVLTDTKNRISFAMDLEKTVPDKNNPCYFAMFTLCGLSTINSRYGNDIGDWALVKGADVLGQIFRDKPIYRTGSGEFVVLVKTENNPDAQQQVLSDVKAALSKLTSQQTTPAGKISFNYKASVIKKSKEINTSVLSTLKSNMNSNDPIGILPFVFRDLDN